MNEPQAERRPSADRRDLRRPNHPYWRSDPGATREMEGYFRTLYPEPSDTRAAPVAPGAPRFAETESPPDEQRPRHTAVQAEARRRIDSIYGNRNHPYWQGEAAATEEMAGYFRTLYPAPDASASDDVREPADLGRTLGFAAPPARLESGMLARGSLFLRRSLPFGEAPIRGADPTRVLEPVRNATGDELVTPRAPGGQSNQMAQGQRPAATSGEAQVLKLWEADGFEGWPDKEIKDKSDKPYRTTVEEDTKHYGPWLNEHLGNITNARAFFRRAEALRPIIEQAAKEAGVPPSLIGGMMGVEVEFKENNPLFTDQEHKEVETDVAVVRGMMSVTRGALTDVLRKHPDLEIGWDDLGDTYKGTLVGALYIVIRRGWAKGDEDAALMGYGTGVPAYTASVRVIQQKLRELGWE